MKTYTIIKKTDTLDWGKIPTAPIDIQLQNEPVHISASAQLCYDEDFLYVHLTAKEEHIRAEYTGPLDAPCEDSCLEFFFCPNYDDDRYFNIEYNPNCCVYLGIASCLNDLVRLVPEFGMPFSPVANRTKDGWEITYQIPFEFVRRFFPDFSPVSGTKMRGNFYKCGDLTVQEHYLCWNPISGTEISFHRPCDFGVLVFEQKDLHRIKEGWHLAKPSFFTILRETQYD